MASIKYQNTGNIIRDSTVHQKTITGGTHFYRDYTAIYLKNEKMMIFINVTWLFLWLLGKIYNALFWQDIDYILNSDYWRIAPTVSLFLAILYNILPSENRNGIFYYIIYCQFYAQFLSTLVFIMSGILEISSKKDILIENIFEIPLFYPVLVNLASVYFLTFMNIDIFLDCYLESSNVLLSHSLTRVLLKLLFYGALPNQQYEMLHASFMVSSIYLCSLIFHKIK